MVYCNRCGIGVAEGFYCVECQPPQLTTLAPSTNLIISTANSNNLVCNSNFKSQSNDIFRAGASNAVSRIHFEFNTNTGLVMDTEYSSERKQCPCCEDWFPNEAGYNWHRKGYPSWCSEHGQCFPRSEIHYHGMKFEHHRCFVQDCPSKYRNEFGWTPRQIKDHVKKTHTYSGRAAT